MFGTTQTIGKSVLTRLSHTYSKRRESNIPSNSSGGVPSRFLEGLGCTLIKPYLCVYLHIMNFYPAHPNGQAS